MFVHDVYTASTIHVNIIHIVFTHKISYYDWFISYVTVVAIIPFIERERAIFPFCILLLLIRFSDCCCCNLIFLGPFVFGLAGSMLSKFLDLRPFIRSVNCLDCILFSNSWRNMVHSMVSCPVVSWNPQYFPWSLVPVFCSILPPLFFPLRLPLRFSYHLLLLWCLESSWENSFVKTTSYFDILEFMLHGFSHTVLGYPFVW